MFDFQGLVLLALKHFDKRDHKTFECASHLLAVLLRLRRTEIPLSESDASITAIAQRFCVSRVSAEMLCRWVQGHEPYVELI